MRHQSLNHLLRTETERKRSMEQDTQWKTKALVLGGVIGAFLGMGTAYLLAQKAEREGETLKLGTGEGIRLGMLALGMLRQVASLGEKGD
jgi:hypothetical protein